MNEIEQLDYDDSILAFFSACQQYGARRVLEDFGRAFPDMLRELVVQLNRHGPENKIAALLKP